MEAHDVKTIVIYMVARNDKMSLPLYIGIFKKCCNYINKRSKVIIDEKYILEQFKKDKKEVQANNRFIIIQTEIEKVNKSKEEIQMEIKEIKYALKNYHKIKEYIRLDLLDLEVIQYRMEGQGGGSIIPCDKGGNEKPTDRTLLLNNLIEKKDAIIKKISEEKYYLQIAKDFINWLEDDNRKMVIDKYINRMSNIELEGKYFYTERRIRQIIDEEIEQFVNEM